MAYLLDTNVLVRLANAADPDYEVAAHAVVVLERRNETIHITSQNLIEFRNAATRPAKVNGLGLPPLIAETQAEKFEAAFPLLPDTPAIYPAWKSLVTASGVIGKQVHDARLVAVCHVHGVTHLLTFNTADFSRFTSIVPGIVIVDPEKV